MLTSFSKYRIENYADYIGEILGFSLYKSHNTSFIKQYYVVPKDWKDRPHRIEPLAHIIITDSGDIKVKTFQPDTFGIYENQEELLEHIKSAILDNDILISIDEQQLNSKAKLFLELGDEVESDSLRLPKGLPREERIEWLSGIFRKV